MVCVLFTDGVGSSADGILMSRSGKVLRAMDVPLMSNRRSPHETRHGEAIKANVDCSLESGYPRRCGDLDFGSIASMQFLCYPLSFFATSRFVEIVALS